MTTRPVFATLLAAALSACSSREDFNTTGTLTSAQRTQVVQIVRDALKQDPSILREAILALQNDNARIEAAATRATIARVHNAVFDPRDATVGSPHGRVVIAEFFDPRCEYCRHLAPQMSRFLDQNRDVQLIYKDFPILGPPSELGSRALLAARRQHAYERLRDAIMRGPEDITSESLRQTAERLGLNWSQLQGDMNDPSISRKLAANQKLAKTLGVESTPTLVIGSSVIAGADMSQIADAVTAVRHGRSPSGLVSTASASTTSGK